MLAKNPGFTAVVILSLGLGIGANTAIFSLVNALMMKSLPVEQPERLVLYSDGRARGFISGQSGRWSIFPYPLYRHLRSQQKSFEDLAAFRTMLDRLSVRPQSAAGGEVPQLAWGRLVSGNYFSVLGVKAASGRILAPEDERLAAAPVAVLSFEYWKRRFQGSPSLVGQVMNMNGVLVTIVGVAPAEFFGESLESQLADVWLPLTLQPSIMPRKSALEEAETSWLNLIARLKPGVTMAQAQAEVNVTFRQFLAGLAGASLTQEQQQELQRDHVVLTSGAGGVSALRSRYSRHLQILLAVVGFVLLIACANVANLLLCRVAAREREISMRVALGAGRGRLLRQLLTESVLLACLGGALGVLLSGWMARALVAGVSTGDRTVPLNISPDVRVLAFTLAVCAFTAILFGLAPAVRALRVDVMTALKGSATAVSGRSRWGLARVFVVAQVALSLPLLVAAALFVQTLRQLRFQDFGFSHEQVLEVGIDPSIAGYKPDQVGALYRTLLSRVQAVPGVRVASLSLYSPMSGDNWSGGVTVEGYTPPPQQGAYCQWVWVGPRYVETQGMTLLLGRDLSERDSEGSLNVAVVNQSFVRRYLPERNPIGRHFSLGKNNIQIVGVVKDFKFNDPRQEVWPVAFMPLVQSSFTPSRFARYLEVRALGDPLSVAATVREALKQVAPNLPVTGIRTLSQQVSAALGREKLIAGISGSFAVLAVLLACIGLYGVVSHAVARRTKEIGVRMALGASQANILSMVMREALWLSAAGVVAGLLASVGLAGAVSSLLYGLKPTDPLTLSGAALLLAAAAALAGFLPALRASHVDPATTLQAE
jgi:predicted permease